MKQVSQLHQPGSPSGSENSRSPAGQGSPGGSIASNSPAGSQHGPHSPGSDSNNSNNSHGSNSFQASPKVNILADPNSVVQGGDSASPMPCNLAKGQALVHSNMNLPEAMCIDSRSPCNGSPPGSAMSISAESSPYNRSPDLRHQQHRIDPGSPISHQTIQQNPPAANHPSASAWHHQPAIPQLGYPNSPPMGPSIQTWPVGVGAGISATPNGSPYTENGSPFMAASVSSPPFVELPAVDVPGHAHEIDRSSMLQSLFNQGRR